jgi:aspartyl-tRNA(Asn)/glutamyl-tRNA(Gln) amidotransferase subunit A
VAAGEADLSLGSDTGGSVRIPAAFCGVVGFKPSRGAVPTAATFPLSPTLDHVGYLVARADQLVAPARVLGLLDAAAEPPPARRLGVARGAADQADGPVADAFAATLEALGRAGVELVDVDWPGGEEVFAATTAIMFAEAAWVHRHLLAERGDRYGADVKARLVQGAAIGRDPYLAARAGRRRARRACLDVLAGVDAVLSPTVPVVPPTVAEAVPAVGARLVAFTRLADLAGLPAVSLPVPGRPLPVGVQVEAGDDAAAIGAALTVASALGP